jgi:O-antigen/teichoic acid export membrane protein
MPAAAGQRRRLVDVVGRLTLTNGAVFAVALITAPLQARALGPEGRGALAAIVVPITIAPWLLTIGLNEYAMRETARGRPRGELIGSVGAVLLVTGFAAVVLGPTAAGLIAHGRDTVHIYLVVGFSLLPFSLIAYLLLGIAIGAERWGIVIATYVTPPLVALLGLSILYAVGRLTVASAAITTFAAGLVSLIPLLPLVRGGGRLEVVPRLVREGLAFGAKAWPAQMAFVSNARLDQLLMAGIVEARELGVYVVGVAFAAFSVPLTNALASVLVPRIAAGEEALAPRAVRVVLAVLVPASTIVAAMTPLVLHVLFGAGFEDAAPVAWVLLVAGLPLAGSTVLTAALISGARPAAATYGQAAGIAVTVPGLIILLPPLGALGAAIVSLTAYGVNFIVLLAFAERRFGGHLRDYVLFNRHDLRWARSVLSDLMGRRSSGGNLDRIATGPPPPTA